jgi:hypothetical protein
MEIQPDPDMNPVTIVIAQMGWSRDFAIYKGKAAVLVSIASTDFSLCCRRRAALGEEGQGGEDVAVVQQDYHRLQ